MHGIDFIQDLAVIMLIAGIVTVLFHRLKQPVVLGYIVAGVIIGPHTPPFALVRDEPTINVLAELGVVFLLFSLGLEFSLRKLARVGVTAVVAALAEIILMIWIGYMIGGLFGWKPMDALFLGAILAISSTTIIVKALDELRMKRERFAQLIYGILIVEDILAIGMIALLSGIALTGSASAGHVLATVGKLALFIVVALMVGLLIVPRLLGYVARFNSNEMLLITVLGLCFGFCLVVVRLDYSIALGAFVIGAIMAESRQLRTIERLIEPIRDMFSAIFFVAIGLLLDPKALVAYAGPIAVITAAVVVGKVLSCGLGAFVAGQDGRTAMRVGMGLAQIGKFSLVAAIFLAGGYVAAKFAPTLGALMTDERVRNAAVWGAALIVSLPFLVAAYRKLGALSLLLAELGVKRELAGQYTHRARRIVAEIIPIGALVVIMLLIATLSACILPSAELLVLVLSLAAGLVALLWRWFVKLHARLQIALRETLSDEREDD